MPLFHPDDLRDEWSEWTPEYSCSGTMTITSTSTACARYKHVGKLCIIELAFSGTLGVADASVVYATLPSGVAGKTGATFQGVPAVDGDGSAESGAALIQTTGGGGKIAIYKNAIGSNWQQGASFQAYLSCSFETE